MSDGKRSSQPSAKSSTRLEFERPILELTQKIHELEEFAANTELDLSGQIEKMRSRCDDLTRELFTSLTPWQKVQLARHVDRPILEDYLSSVFSSVVELHGDRHFADDRAILTAFATLGEHRILLIGHRKGKNTRDRLDCNFGSPNPEGYRKALHKMRLAEKFGIPVISLINTPGAFPGVDAEERGQALAIAENIEAMSSLRTPLISVVLGEGGSGGALGIGVSDRLLMLEHAYYSVISPEGCAAILWKDTEHVAEAARILKLTSADLKVFGIVDEILPEPLGGAHRDPEKTASVLKSRLIATIEELLPLPIEQLLEARYRKFRQIGQFIDRSQPDDFLKEAAPAPVESAVRALDLSPPQPTAQTWP